jgi:chromosome partitioning protein
MPELLDFVRELIERGDIRITDLEKHGIHRSVISRLGKGKRGPTVETLENILSLYGYRLGIHKGENIMKRQQIFTFFNDAGGVAKTTTCREMAVGMALRGFKVLVVDLDHQSSLTSWIGVQDKALTLDDTVFNACVNKDTPLPIPREIHGVDVIPAIRALSGLDMGRVDGPMVLYLRKNLQRYREQYDFILIDSPPSLGIRSQIAALASDGLVVPMSTDAKSWEGYEGIIEFKEKYEEWLPGGELRIAAHVATKHNPKTVSAKTMYTKIVEECEPIAPVLGPLEVFEIYNKCMLLQTPVLIQQPVGSAANQLRKMVDDFVKLVQPKAGAA